MISTQAKFEAVVESLQGKKSVAEICREYEISENLLLRWRQTFFERGAELFEAPLLQDSATHQEWLAALGGAKVGKSKFYPGGLLVLDLSLQISYASPEVCGILECEPGDMNGQMLEELFSPKDRKGSLAFHNKLSQYEGGFLDVVVILQIRGKDFLSRLRMIRQQNLWVAVCENVLAEDDDLFRQFHLGRERWTSIVRNSSEGIAMLDVEGRLVEFNSRFLEMMQFRSARGVLLNEEALFDRRLFDLFDHAENEEVEAAFESARHKKKMRFTSEILYNHQHYQLELTPIYFPVQGFVGCSFVVKDITAKKQLEQAVADLDAYAHTVAHDLKNPVGAIVSYLEFINDQNFDIPEKLEGYLEKISRISRQTVDIINALLMLASIGNQEDIPVEPLDMENIVGRALHRLTPLADESAAQIIQPDQWPVALGYASWIEEIWANYISNAIKYGGSPPVIHLGADRIDGEVHFWVRDNGKGMSEKELATLFEEFSRLAQHATIEGHGLGLSIVKRVVEKLGGRVDVDSTLGAGSTFYFILPDAKTVG